MKMLVFGKTGQLARELQLNCPASYSVTLLGREDADLGAPAACARIIEQTDADVVVNAAAFTAVDLSESQPDLAKLINAEAPAAMSAAAAQRNLPFVQVSTDYVFDGSGDAPWKPDAATAPLGVYGLTKRDGEQAVRATGGTHVILRTSWVFSAYGSNFVKTMLRLGATRSTISVVKDQTGGPTPAAAIAEAVMSIAAQLKTDPGKTGTYHFSGRPSVSWADFARTIFARAGFDCKVTDIETKDYPTPARRPGNSRLDCSSLRDTFGIGQPDWEQGLIKVLETLETAA